MKTSVKRYSLHLLEVKTWMMAILVTAGMIFSGCITENPTNPTHLKLGAPLPEFSVSGPSGIIKSPEDFAGKRTLIVLFRTTCGDCKREMPKVQKAWEDFGNNPNFRLAAISREESQVLADYWKDSKFTMPYYIDTDGSVFSKFQVGFVPTLYLFGSDKKVAYVAIENAEGLTELIGELQ